MTTKRTREDAEGDYREMQHLAHKRRNTIGKGNGRKNSITQHSTQRHGSSPSSKESEIINLDEEAVEINSIDSEDENVTGNIAPQVYQSSLQKSAVKSKRSARNAIVPDNARTVEKLKPSRALVKKAPRGKIIVKSLPLPIDPSNFPRYKGGDVYIIIHPNDSRYQYQLHNDILASASPKLARLLLEKVDELDERIKISGTRKCKDVPASFGTTATARFDIEFLPDQKCWLLKRTAFTTRLPVPKVEEADITQRVAQQMQAQPSHAALEKMSVKSVSYDLHSNHSGNLEQQHHQVNVGLFKAEGALEKSRREFKTAAPIYVLIEDSSAQSLDIQNPAIDNKFESLEPKPNENLAMNDGVESILQFIEAEAENGTSKADGKAESESDRNAVAQAFGPDVTKNPNMVVQHESPESLASQVLAESQEYPLFAPPVLGHIESHCENASADQTIERHEEAANNLSIRLEQGISHQGPSKYQNSPPATVTSSEQDEAILTVYGFKNIEQNHTEPYMAGAISSGTFDFKQETNDAANVDQVPDKTDLNEPERKSIVIESIPESIIKEENEGAGHDIHEKISENVEAAANLSKGNDIPGTGRGGHLVRKVCPINPPKSVCESYDTLFRIMFSKPKFFRTIQVALEHSEEVVSLSFQFECLPIIRPYFGFCLAQFGSDIGKHIAENPPRWMRLAIDLENPLIFREAVVHIVGMYPKWEWADIGLEEFTVQVQNLIHSKAKKLEKRKMLLHEKMSHNAISIGNLRVSLTSEDPSIFETWLATQIWRDWFSTHVAPLNHPDSTEKHLIGEMYRTMAAGGDAYLRLDDVRHSLEANLGPEFSNWESLAEDIGVMKEFARKQVEEICENHSMLNVAKEGIKYLTCTTVTDQELPWKTR